MTHSEARRTPAALARRVRGLLLGSTFGPLLGLIAVLVFFSAADALQEGGGHFASARNVRAMTVQTATVAVAALGMTVIIISGGIDLSAGTALALCAVVLAWSLKEDVALLAVEGENVATADRALEQARERLSRQEREITSAKDEAARQSAQAEREGLAAEVSRRERRAEELRAASARWTPWTPWAAVALAVATGVLCGLVNGVLVSALRVVPFIITLGTMTIFLGLAKLAANETTVRPDKARQIPEWLRGFTSLLPDDLRPRGRTGVGWVDGALDYVRLPAGVWLTLAAAALLAAALRFTVFSRHVFAIGSNEAAARLCGVGVRRTKAAVYALGGLFVGFAGIYHFSRLSNGSPTSGSGMELKIIAAVVIGGGSLSGGRGTVLGTLAGAAIMSVVESGCTQLGLRNPLQDIILGVIIVAAVAVDQLRQRRAAS